MIMHQCQSCNKRFECQDGDSCIHSPNEGKTCNDCVFG